MITTAAIIFVLTYLGIIFTRLPGVNIDRPSASFFGAVAMVVFGVFTFDEAINAIDFNTIALLIGMMIIITILELDGFFAFIANKTITLAKNERRLLFIIIFTTGISSAFLVNDAVVLLYTPIVISICRDSKINPIPYLIAEILASNTGSAMTITGNPQNMLIGLNSGISYSKFLLHLMPVSFIGMLIIYFVIKYIYPERFKKINRIDPHAGSYEYNYLSMKFSAPIFVLVIVLFFVNGKTGLSIPVISLIGASLILILGKIKPSEIIKNIDWVLILFFSTLFIVVGGIEKTGLIQHIIETYRITPDLHGIGVIHGISLVLSQVVSNVPYTILMIPVLKNSGSDIIWLSLASASTIAGNATIFGAMANIIVIESAKKQDVHITFFEFLKAGVIVTALTLLLSVLLLYIQISFI
jgi:Na+/H+ antiporter NhaD/arsenite permease-like protein